MKFPAFKDFRPPENLNLYLEKNLSPVLREWATGLSRLKFIDNFESFQATVVFNVGQTYLELANKLPSRKKATMMLITMPRLDWYKIYADPDEWDDQRIILRNIDAAVGPSADIVFFR